MWGHEAEQWSVQNQAGGIYAGQDKQLWQRRKSGQYAITPDGCCEYCANPKKTDAILWANSEAVKATLGYAADRDKTEQCLFVSGINCSPTTDAQEFQLTKYDSLIEFCLGIVSILSCNPLWIYSRIFHKGIRVSGCSQCHLHFWGIPITIVGNSFYNFGYFYITKNTFDQMCAEDVLFYARYKCPPFHHCDAFELLWQLLLLNHSTHFIIRVVIYCLDDL